MVSFCWATSSIKKRVPSLKLTVRHLKIDLWNFGDTDLETHQFSGAFAVSFREGAIPSISTPLPIIKNSHRHSIFPGLHGEMKSPWRFPWPVVNKLG